MLSLQKSVESHQFCHILILSFIQGISKEGISVESNQDHVIVVLSIWLILQMKILIKVNEISFLEENRWPP